MKRRLLLHKSLKQAALAVPAAALMLGAAQAGTTVGLNFQAWYYDSGTTPQTIGFGQGYQTTGWPVTARAFGVDVNKWVNTDPLDCSSALDTSVTMGSVTAHLTTVNMWSGDIGNLVDPANEWTAGFLSTVLPGNDEVTWGYQDNTGWTNNLTGLNAAFPNGCVIELIGTVKCTANSRVVVEQGATITTNAFDVVYTAGNANYPGPVGLMAISTSSDTITFGAASRNINLAQSCALAGFIITDQPLVSRIPKSVTVNQGNALNLTARVVGIGTITYQWQHAGTNYPGATTVPFSKTAAPEDAGSWVLVATNPYGTTTSDATAVTVNQVPLITKNLPSVTNNVLAGFNTALSIVAGGAEPLNYQWIKDGVAISGATSAALTVSNLTAGLSGYSVVVTNLYGTANSATNYLKVVASPDTYTPQVGKDAPIAYWPLNENAGSTAYDYAGFGHDATIMNSPTLGVVGPRPPSFPGFSSGTTAYQFDGASSFVDCGTGPALAGTTDFTLEAWVNTTSTTFARLIQQRSGFNGEYMFDINADGTVAFTIYGDGGYQYSFGTSTSVNDGKWHHIVAVRATTNGFIYVDGGLAAQASGTLRNLDPSFTVGLGKDFRDNVSYYNGLLASVAIYNKALTAGQVINHYATASGTVFKMTLSPGGMIEDSKPLGTPRPGQGHSLVWVASAADSAAPPVTRTGVSKFATASGSQVVIPANSDFDSASGTIMFWVRVPVAALPGPGNEGAMLFDRRLTSGAVIVLNDAGAIFFQGQAGSRNSLTAGYLVDDLWHHVAVTYGQTTSDSISIYIDGALNGSVQVTNAWSWPAAQQIEIGKSHDGYWKRFDGQMDDFRIYSRILTEAEIASVKASDALVDTSALKVRYNFGTAAGVGQTVSWTFGTLLSSPTLGPSAVWTPVPGAVSPYAFMPAESALFFRAVY